MDTVSDRAERKDRLLPRLNSGVLSTCLVDSLTMDMDIFGQVVVYSYCQFKIQSCYSWNTPQLSGLWY